MATTDGFRRVLYTSIPTGSDFGRDRLAIVEQSQRANSLDGVTGVLWGAPDLYIQVLEGPPKAVGDTFERIQIDQRHRSIAILSDTINPDRVFGAWAMLGLWDAGELSVTTQRLLDLIVASGSTDADRLANCLTAGG